MLSQLSLRRRGLFLLASSVLCIWVSHTCRKILWNTRDAGLEAFQDEDDSCGRFESWSPFRKDPDYDYEQRTDSALLALQRREESKLPPHFSMKRIWQTWRDRAVLESFDQPAVWRHLNSGWEHNMVSDRDDSALLSDELATVPGFQHLFYSSHRPILRANLLRYSFLWHCGGFYADIDVHPVCSIESCGPMRPLFTEDKSSHISLVIGVEIDEPYASARRQKFWDWDSTHGFIQYTMYAPRPFSPILRCAIVRSIAHSVKHEGGRRPRYQLADKSDRPTVLQLTGPGMFTEAVLDILSETLPSNHSLKVAERQKDTCPMDNPARNNLAQRERVTWASFYRLKEALWIDDKE